MYARTAATDTSAFGNLAPPSPRRRLKRHQLRPRHLSRSNVGSTFYDDLADCLYRVDLAGVQAAVNAKAAVNATDTSHNL